ncbi:MAG: ABC transporter substrate-binding protein [Spirochaetes bacterium]|nr:ABC transporter substrate-binding protein [Spirochaetota bacterium]
MKKNLFTVCVAFFLALIFIFTGCKKSEQTGGILRCIRGTFPNVLGYPPEMAPGDFMFSLPYSEKLCVWDEDGNQIPELAESWDVDPEKKTITWHLRKGVKFHDGTDFNAEAAKWNFQLLIDNRRLLDQDLLKSVEAVDDYTLRMNLKELTCVSVMNYGWSIMLSPTAFEKNGGKEWARKNAVGTGPYVLTEFKRDTVVRYVKNNNYWREGYPLLDGIEMRFIPDPNTASMMMEKKDADIWMDTADVKYILELEKKGLKVVWGPGMFWSLLPDSSDPKSPFAKKQVREALEYAIDRPAIAKAIGLGQFEPLTQMAPLCSPAYNKGFNPRPYDPEKAKALLAEAGYPDGFSTRIMALDLNKDIVTALQNYLGKAGIKVEMDIADMGRYFGAIFATGWKDLMLAASGINPDATGMFVHYGSRPMTFRTGTFAKSKEFLDICEKALHTYRTDDVRKELRKAVKKGSEDAMIIPLYRSAQANVMQDYVHSDYMKIHGVTWYAYKDWMEKH